MENNKKSKPKRNKERIIIDLIIAFLVALIVDTGNFALDIIIVAVALIIIDIIISLAMKGKTNSEDM